MDTTNLTTENVITALKAFMSEQEYDGFAICCIDKAEAELLLAALHALGRYWDETQPLVTEEGRVDVRFKYKRGTCYRFYLQDSIVMKGERAFYEKKGLTVYPFEELITTYLRFDNDTDTQSKPQPEQISQVAEVKNNGEIKEVKLKSDKKEQSESESSSEYEKPNIKEVVKRSETAQKDDLPPLCKLLGVGVKEPFLVECSKILLFLPNTLYRVNENGIREYLVDSKNQWWVSCDDEKELSYLISHPEIVVKY